MQTVAATTNVAKSEIIDVDPYFVRRGKNGWEPCDRKDAEAIAKYNKLYAIGDEPIAIGPVIDEDGYDTGETEYAPQAVIYDVPDGDLTVNLIHHNTEHTGQIADLEAGELDLADTIEQTAADTETAVIELADVMGSTTEETQTGLLEVGDMLAAIDERLAAIEEALGLTEGE